MTDSDDWRVTISLTGQEQAAAPASLPEAEEDIRRQLGHGAETAESRATGMARWQVRVELPFIPS